VLFSLNALDALFEVAETNNHNKDVNESKVGDDRKYVKHKLL